MSDKVLTMPVILSGTVKKIISTLAINTSETKRHKYPKTSRVANILP